MLLGGELTVGPVNRGSRVSYKARETKKTGIRRMDYKQDEEEKGTASCQEREAHK